MKGAKNMEINKQLFEDVLSSKSKGTFVLRNGNIISSDRLRRAQQHKAITAQSYSYILEGKYCTKDKYYTENGWFISDYIYHPLDIVDFIPEINMETKELTIEIPEGFEIDKKNSSFEKIVFKKKEDTKPRSWEEYERTVLKDMGYKDTVTATINITFPSLFVKVSDYKFLQEHTAFIKLCMLRKAWIGDWEPDWKDYYKDKYCIKHSGISGIKFTVGIYGNVSRVLSFPSEEMATDFMNTFKDLLEIAKPLI